MPKRKYKKNSKCELFPYEEIPFISILSAAQQYGWQVTDFMLPDVWKKTQGEGVNVAVLDTGVDFAHDDIKSNMLQGYNVVKSSEDPMDRAGHGTHVAGIIAATKNEIGMVGVAPKSKIIPVKVLGDNGSGNLNDVAQGIRWAANNGADMICMSLGAPQALQQVRKAVQYAGSKNIPVFVAAGNSGRTKKVFFPANYPETIAIGSIDQDLSRSSFSNTGANLDFIAPGGEIFSTMPGNQYGILSGTSMATPVVVGICALLLSFCKNNDTKIQLNKVEDFRNILKQHTTNIKDEKMAGKKFFQGFGIIEPKKLIEWAASQQK